MRIHRVGTGTQTQDKRLWAERLSHYAAWGDSQRFIKQQRYVILHPHRTLDFVGYRRLRTREGEDITQNFTWFATQ